ncbi:hypothetical protein GCM10007989_26260 [Devosia pacifica]|uniref:GGDEF domain-containing protein n=1 Tax=Devosia pacifica TaxID=1335967 RepID=A0A918S7W9_9HYPH|nr:hypothetical protein [Devosia pacifica]GHA29422.1 hypothetical protein GCM10007989_26260 [Devosia pacifica]
MVRSRVTTLLEQLRASIDRLRPVESVSVDYWQAQPSTEPDTEGLALPAPLAASFQQAWVKSQRRGLTVSVIVFGLPEEQADEKSLTNAMRILDVCRNHETTHCHELGGDRFAVLLADYPLMLARHLASRTIDAAAQEGLHLSAGIATVNAIGSQSEDVVREAIAALEQAMQPTTQPVVCADLRSRQKRLPLAS